MDDVAIVTTNPVRTIVAPKPKIPSKPKPPGTMKNFFYMLPFAVVIILQAFWFGKAVGNFTTFPIFTVQAYLNLGMLVMLMVVVQVLLRSIVYSTLFGAALLSGIFFAWFGDWWHPVLQNFKEVLTIMESAWSKKDVPYPILASGIITLSLAIVVVGNFFCSLIVKYFFEIVFGTEWSDGRRNAFAFSIVLMLVFQGMLTYYHGNIMNTERVIWKVEDKYRPIEEYLVRLPSGGQIGPDHVWTYDPFQNSAFEIATGREIRKQKSSSVLLAPSWSKVAQPFVATEKELTFFDKDLMLESSHCLYPASFAFSNEAPRGEGGEEASAPARVVAPLLVRPDVSPNLILVMFDYGVWGVVSPIDGKFLWARPIDIPVRNNRLFLEEMLSPGVVLSLGDLLYFSCLNGRVVAVKADSGIQVWEYNHSDTKYLGKSQRALLSAGKGKILAAFPSGSLVSLEATSGAVDHEVKNPDLHPVTPATWLDGDVAFITTDGHYYRLEIDGGRVKFKYLVAENRLPLMPLPIDLARGFIGYREALLHVATSTNSVEPALRLPKHIFATTPVFEDPLMYVGTQDGWVICLHAGSNDEKWRAYVGGELTEDSLALTAKGLLVRTKSGSVTLLKKTPE